MRTAKLTCLTALSATALVIGIQPANADQQILDDLIVDGSACIGQDCVNGESFGFDTLRLKENNLRIKFDDTSNSASFPNNDWQLTANDSTNGGANKFSIDDVSGGRTPFTIEASAPSHSLYVDDGGRIGLGTSTPVVEVHVKDGDSPTLRLEQDGSSGFTPQTWDLAGNETNFFVRDVTNGSKLPFRIKPGAPTDSLFVAADGDIGLGTTSPNAALDVVQSTGGFSNGLQLQNNSGIGFVLDNTTSDAVFVSVNNPGTAFTINFDDGANTEFSLDANGDLTLEGGVVSDRNRKHEFETIDREEMLELLLKMDVSSWSYKDDSSHKRHIGPVSQDVHATFGVGNETAIHPVDMFGISAAAIQGLSEQVEELRALVREQEKMIKELRSVE